MSHSRVRLDSVAAVLVGVSAFGTSFWSCYRAMPVLLPTLGGMNTAMTCFFAFMGTVFATFGVVLGLGLWTDLYGYIPRPGQVGRTRALLRSIVGTGLIVLVAYLAIRMMLGWTQAPRDPAFSYDEPTTRSLGPATAWIFAVLYGLVATTYVVSAAAAFVGWADHWRPSRSNALHLAKLRWGHRLERLRLRWRHGLESLRDFFIERER